MTPKQTVFQASHRFDDSWGFYNRPQQVDLDLARDICELVGKTANWEVEDLIARALARHRNWHLYSGGRYMNVNDEGDET